MRFAFRADASSAIGFGHVSRAVALATAAVKTRASVVLVASRPGPEVRAFAAYGGIALEGIDAEPGTSDDARATAVIAGRGSHVIVHGYAFHARYLGELGGDARVVAYIDDLAAERFACDAVINPNVSGAVTSYDTAPKTALLAGPSFAIVHD